ncbi:lacticin RM [Listeria monocytogenes]|nr:lacticin RM [Listeria monocytogenes]EAC9864701.1 lacticin RM [Listeria monocytogenes]EAD0273352.1 lacticin RM [Listeria monocytogenes]EAD0296430.1 lacticin RM [Listeria monocytogenes]EAD0431634.1 lacticin RM [Listeria monocytogenes]
MKKYISTFFVLSLSLLLVTPNFVKASDDVADVDVSPEQAISQIDSVGVEEVIESSDDSGVRLLKAAAYKNKTYSYKRGGVAAWCKDYISFKYNGSTVKENSKWQEAGFIFPNIIRKKGITNYQNGSGYKDYRGAKVYRVGVPSPWGDATLTEQSRSDYYRLKSNGSAYKK